MENHGEKETCESLDSGERSCRRVVGFIGWGLFNAGWKCFEEVFIWFPKNRERNGEETF